MNHLRQPLSLEQIEKELSTNLSKLYQLNNDKLLKIYQDEMNIYDDIIRYFYFVKNLPADLDTNPNAYLSNTYIPLIFDLCKSQVHVDVTQEENLLVLCFPSVLVTIITAYSDNQEYFLSSRVQLYLQPFDTINAICQIDEHTRGRLIKIACSLYVIPRSLTHTISLFRTISCQLSSFDIHKVYGPPSLQNSDETKEALDMSHKFTKRQTTCQFWIQLNPQQQNKLLRWYNAKAPDDVMNHPDASIY